MRISIRTSAVAAIAGLLAVEGSALAQDFEEGGELYAVQNRKYIVSHAFDLGVGVLPMDAFYKGLTFSFSYTYHFDDMWAWEIVNASYSFAIETTLRQELEANFGVRPTQFPELNFFFNSNAVFKPLYGKMVWFNDSLIYGELYFTAGPAIARYENAGVYVGVNFGGGLRIYLTRAFAVRLEVRDYQYFSASTPLFADSSNELFIQAGIGLNIR